MSEPAATTPTWMLWTGRVVSFLPIFALTASGIMKLLKPQPLVEGFQKFGYSLDVAIPIGIVEIACVVLYAIPQTAVLGAILLTGYLGGAVATHVRIGDPAGEIAPPIVIGVLVWVGLYLRDARVRELAPWRKL